MHMHFVKKSIYSKLRELLASFRKILASSYYSYMR